MRRGPASPRSTAGASRPCADSTRSPVLPTTTGFSSSDASWMPPGAVGVELTQGELVGQPPHPHQERFEGGDVHCGPAPIAEQQRRCPHRADELGRVRVGQRQDPVGTVAEQIRGDTGDAEGDEGAEDGVLHGPDRDRHPRRRHPLHHQRGIVQAGQRLEGRAQLRLVGEVEPDAAQSGTVSVARRGRLERHRPAQRACRRHRRVGRGHRDGLVDLDPVDACFP